MEKYKVVTGIVPVVSILLLMVLAFGQSSRIENIYDQRMHRDIQGFTQRMIQSGMPLAQVKALHTELLDINRHTLSYVTSETFNLVGVFTFMIIIILSFTLGLALRLADDKKVK